VVLQAGKHFSFIVSLLFVAGKVFAGSRTRKKSISKVMSLEVRGK
jgi:hypothetical protein